MIDPCLRVIYPPCAQYAEIGKIDRTAFSVMARPAILNRLCISRVVIHEYSTAELRFSEVREIPFTASFAFPDPTHLLCRQPSHSDE